MENKADWAVFVYETQQEAWDLTKEAASTQDNDTEKTLCTYFDEGQRSPGVAKPLSCPAVRSEAVVVCEGGFLRQKVVLNSRQRMLRSGASRKTTASSLRGFAKYASEIGEGGSGYEIGRQGLGTLNLDLRMLEFVQERTLLAQQHWPPRGPAEVDAFLARLRQEIEEAKTRPKG
eukprot:g3067.t1